MSYCRFSSDDFQCDVYVYESDMGYEVHVANYKTNFHEPTPAPIKLTPENILEYVDRVNKVLEMLEKADKQPIGLPHDGESYCFDTALQAANCLIQLKVVGYRVPQCAIDSLLEESEEK